MHQVRQYTVYLTLIFILSWRYIANVKMNSKQTHLQNKKFRNKQIVWVACGMNHEGILVPGSTGVLANMAACGCQFGAVRT